MTARVVTVKYRCYGGCHPAEEWQPVQCPERPEHEDVRDWVELARALVHHYHTADHPGCTSKVLDLKIPLPPGEPNAWIGKAPSAQ